MGFSDRYLRVGGTVVPKADVIADALAQDGLRYDGELSHYVIGFPAIASFAGVHENTVRYAFQTRNTAPGLAQSLHLVHWSRIVDVDGAVIATVPVVHVSTLTHTLGLGAELRQQQNRINGAAGGRPRKTTVSSGDLSK